MAIIGLLVALLLPAGLAVRRQAYATMCASNLRQMGTAWMMYANDNRGAGCPLRPPKFPAPSTNLYLVAGVEVQRPRWYALLGGELGISPFDHSVQTPRNDSVIKSEAFLCPAVPEWNDGRNYPYGYNYQFLGNMRVRDDGGGYINFPVRVSRISAAQTVMAADSMGTAAHAAPGDRLPYQSDGAEGSRHLGNHGWTLDPPRLTPEGDFSEMLLRGDASGRTAPDARHGKAANVAFCDGHVERMTLEEMGYAVNADQSVAVNGAGARGTLAHNRLFSGTGADDDPPHLR